jgi:hypothetical protein
VWKRPENVVLSDSALGEFALESRSLGLRGVAMRRFIDGEDRMQQTLLPNSLEDYVSEENPVRVIEAFIEELDLAALGFSGMTPAATGRPAYHPSTLLKNRCGCGPTETLPPVGAISTAPRPSLPTALPAPPRTPAGKARLLDVRRRKSRDTDSPLEGAGFEPSVPAMEIRHL